MRRAGVLAVWLTLAGCDACGSRPTAGATTESASTRARAPAPSPAPSATGALHQDAAAGPTDAGPTAPRTVTWTYDRTGVGPMQVVVAIPGHSPGQRFPVLIAMHGRGEAFKGPAHGSRGWLDDYGMAAALERLHAPPLTARDFENLAGRERLERFNATLARRPYRELIVVCPYTPDILAGDRPFAAALPLGKFLVDELLPRVYRETPALGTAESTGVDGVSLGGRASVLVGLARPEAFGAVGALQAAFDSADGPELAARAKAAREKNPKLVLRLLTSEGDFYLRANRAIGRALEHAGVAHELTVIPGPHDYEFNRGPGVYEMLLFHERALRGEPMFE